MNLRHSLTLCIASLLVVSTTFQPLAYAQQEYDDQTIQEVNDHFRKGAQLYYDGDYDAAIDEFESAHRKIPNAIFLYNISLAQAKQGKLEESLDTAEKADEFGGLGESEQVQNQARIASMRRVLAANEAAEDIKRGPVEPLFNFSTLGWVGSGLVVGGILGLGGVVFLDRSLSDEVDAHRAAVAAGNTATADALADEIRPTQTSAKVLLVLSSVAVAAGVGLIVWDVTSGDDNTTATLVPTNDGVAFSVTHRF